MSPTPFDGMGRDADEPVTFIDKRRIDPDTGAVREGFEGFPAGPAPSGPGPGSAPAESQREEVAELTADLQRVQADFANYRKRALRDQELAAERSKAVVLSQLLPVLDDLDRARGHGDLEVGPMKSVADKLTGVLANLGLVEFGAQGEEFDPSLHEAVQHEGDGSGESSQVIGHVMRKGYKLGDQVLRHALVGVVDTIGDAGTAESNSESDQ